MKNSGNKLANKPYLNFRDFSYRRNDSERAENNIVIGQCISFLTPHISLLTTK